MTKKWYRSPRGKVFGVCTGLAEWRDLDPKIVRLIVLLTVIFTGFFPGAIIYLVFALVIPMNPETESRSYAYADGKREEEPSDEDLKKKYEDLKHKVETMESDMFDKERDWDDRFNSGK